MFLSKVTLNSRHRITYRLLSDVYAQHCFVMSAFPDLQKTERPDEGSQSEQGVLYRLETMLKSDQFYFLVQSVTEPDWEKTDTLHPDVVCSTKQGELNPICDVGSRYRFRLRASPTVCRVNRDKSGERQKSKREGIFTEDGQREWLARTGERCGFNPQAQAVLITPKGKLEGHQTKATQSRRGNNITCFAVDYDGVLVVTDGEKFAESLREGVGRGKAWGCGLLSILRA